jgi:hypothetical protein
MPRFYCEQDSREREGRIIVAAWEIDRPGDRV